MWQEGRSSGACLLGGLGQFPREAWNLGTSITWSRDLTRQRQRWPGAIQRVPRRGGGNYVSLPRELEADHPFLQIYHRQS